MTGATLQAEQSGTRSSARPKLYFVNGPVDFLLIGGGSILLFAAAYYFHADKRTDTVIGAAAWLAWVVNWPHFAATSFRLYRSRSNIRQYPLTAVAIPIVVAGLAATALGSPLFLAPAFVHLFILWSPYHFSGQSVGITLLYARRGGVTVGRYERLALSTFIFGTFVLQTLRSEGAGQRGSFWGVTYPTLGVPAWVVSVSTIGLWLSGAVFLGTMVLFCLRERRIIPPILLVPAVSQFSWFVLGPTRQSYVEFVPFFHALQYLLIAWSMQLRERTDALGIAPTRRFMVGTTARWALINLAGGAFLFWMIPRAVEKAGYPFAIANAVVLAAVQIHHFFVDGVIWKLKNPKVGNPLLARPSDASVPSGVATAPAA